MVQKGSKIWMDGKTIPWEEANVHILTHSLHYGLGVFEGIRCYLCHDGKSSVFRLREHVDRLFDSAQIGDIRIPYSKREISEACKETLRANQLKEGYIRPIVFIGEESWEFIRDTIQSGLPLPPGHGPIWEKGLWKGDSGKNLLFYPAPC